MPANLSKLKDIFILLYLVKIAYFVQTGQTLKQKMLLNIPDFVYER